MNFQFKFLILEFFFLNKKKLDFIIKVIVIRILNLR